MPVPHRKHPGYLPGAGVLTILLLCAAPAYALDALPEWLSETGLYAAGTRQIAPDVLPFSPQYALWSDGATKRRWLWLPPGTAIDATRPDAWEFPPGTRLWKEFSHGTAVETRFIERLADGTWRFAAYVWDTNGTDARLAPADGFRAYPAPAAPGGRYAVPSRDDCIACHGGAAVPVLGVSALQLSPDRDPLAPHAEVPPAGAVDLDGLITRGLLVNAPASLMDRPPRIAAASPVERAALGYLHANCGHCHNDSGALLIDDMLLAQSWDGRADATRHTLVGQPSEFQVHGLGKRVVPGNAAASVLPVRMRSRNPIVQMPPLGTRITDDASIALVETWIQQLLQPDQEIK